MKRFIAILALILVTPASAQAGNVGITGGTNGPACNSGGYFTPSSVTINSGDTITFSVPSNDPYSGGLQINGFPQGSFVVSTGGSVTTAPITANVSFNGTWPNSPSCQKGSGTVTVNAPAPSPSPAPTPTPAPTSSPKSISSPSPSPTPTPAPVPTAAPTTTTSVNSNQTSPTLALPSTAPKSKSNTVLIAGVAAGGGAVLLLGIVALILITRRKKIPDDFVNPGS